MTESAAAVVAVGDAGSVATATAIAFGASGFDVGIACGSGSNAIGSWIAGLPMTVGLGDEDFGGGGMDVRGMDGAVSGGKGSDTVAIF